MKKKFMALLLMAGGAGFAATHFAIGVQIGRPAPVIVPAPVVADSYQPPCPGPGYLWIQGYSDEFGNWHAGYWTLPPYTGAYWVAPRFVSGHFNAGYWAGPREVYRPAPRFTRPGYEHDSQRAFDRRAPERGRSEFRGDHGRRRGDSHR
jgi:hypothetical protein